MNEYYGNNDWRDYLALKHHGIKEQKWGKKNGPPYPLGYGDHSSAEKKANPKSRLDNYDSPERVQKKRITKTVDTQAKKKTINKESDAVKKVKDILSKTDSKLKDIREAELSYNKKSANTSNELLNKAQDKLQETSERLNSSGPASDSAKDKTTHALKKIGLGIAKGATSVAKQGSYEYDREKYRKAMELNDRIQEIKDMPATSSKFFNDNRERQIKEYQNQIDEILSGISDENLQRIRKSSRLL